MDANNPHNYDCALCGAPCRLQGHENCPRAGGFTTTRVVRCWDHGMKKVTTERAVPTVRTVPTRTPTWAEWQERRRPETHYQRQPQPVRPRPEPVQKAKADPELASLIDNEQERTDQQLRERISKGDV